MGLLEFAISDRCLCVVGRQLFGGTLVLPRHGTAEAAEATRQSLDQAFFFPPQTQHDGITCHKLRRIENTILIRQPKGERSTRYIHLGMTPRLLTPITAQSWATTITRHSIWGYTMARTDVIAARALWCSPSHVTPNSFNYSPYVHRSVGRPRIYRGQPGIRALGCESERDAQYHEL